MNQQQTAIITGASGATGHEIVKQLLESSHFDRVKVFVLYLLLGKTG